ncbi:hypothetical protein MRX96_008915 [Rhipicephalus microplus]
MQCACVTVSEDEECRHLQCQRPFCSNSSDRRPLSIFVATEDRCTAAFQRHGAARTGWRGALPLTGIAVSAWRSRAPWAGMDAAVVSPQRVSSSREEPQPVFFFTGLREGLISAAVQSVRGGCMQSRPSAAGGAVDVRRIPIEATPIWGARGFRTRCGDGIGVLVVGRRSRSSAVALATVLLHDSLHTPCASAHRRLVEHQQPPRH